VDAKKVHKLQNNYVHRLAKMQNYREKELSDNYFDETLDVIVVEFIIPCNYNFI